VPLVTRARLLGAALFAAVGMRRHFDEATRAVAEEVARRAAVAIENAQLYEEAKAGVRLREEILAVVSHDLKSPLGSMLLNAASLQEQLSDGPARKSVQLILRAGQRMSRLIRDLLDLDSIRTGRLALELRVHAPATIVDEAVELLGPLARERRLALTGAHVPSLADVRCDRDRILQVLENLVANALHVTPAGGTIQLRADAVDHGVRFAVADTGPGIREEDQAHVFDRLWRAEGTSYKGTGRGLAIAQGIVEAHGGRIWVESRVGAGATFYFTLPA
jgi:signal transduction histidine kinase